jgi:hypothetical protein
MAGPISRDHILDPLLARGARVEMILIDDTQQVTASDLQPCFQLAVRSPPAASTDAPASNSSKLARAQAN